MPTNRLALENLGRRRNIHLHCAFAFTHFHVLAEDRSFKHAVIDKLRRINRAQVSPKRNATSIQDLE